MALEVFRQEPENFDMALVDYAIGSENGLEICAALLEIRLDLPVVLMTGSVSSIDEKLMSLIGIRELVMKPMRMQQLARLVDSALDQASHST